GQRLAVYELEERAPWIEARHHDGGVDLVTVLENDAGGAAFLHQHVCDWRVDADLGTLRASGARDRFADLARAAALEAPCAKRAVDLAHVVMQQHVRRSR